ncbi:MAG TPA: DUF3300 domain-containing protein [Acidobacteriaceae bacterium]|nr:DUF3300 domain-containing protein [Acidobacteriaceae bacterium]
MNAHRFPHRRWMAGISGLIFSCTAVPLLAQTVGSYGVGTPNPQQNYGPPQTDVAPPPPDYEDNGSYANQPYPNQPGYGSGYAAENAPPNPSPNYPGNYPPNDGAANPNQPQALSDDQLEQLVAPVALDPDTLLAQILAAATWPQQIIEADQWRQAQGDAPPQMIAAGANAQSWDPSVKALTAFPQVLQELDQNLQWTTELGNAYYNEPDAVLGTVQTLRQQAQAAGTLQNTPQESVSDNNGYIQLAPPNPNVVYVPSYNPWNAYGQPIAPYPGFSLLNAIGDGLGSALQYGMGNVLSAFTPFGWLGWGLNWLVGGLFFHGEGWYPHNAALMDWGLPYGGPRWDWRHGGGYGWDRGYGRGGFGRGGDRGYGRGYGQGYGRGYGNRGSFGYARGTGLDQRGIYHGPARPIGNGFGGREIQGVRGSYAVRGGYGGREQQAWNRSPSFNGGRTAYGRGSYGSGYAGRGGSSFRSSGATYGSRSGSGYGGGFRGGYGNASSGFRSPTVARNFGGSGMRGGSGNSYRAESSRSESSRSFSGRGYAGGSSHSGGFHGFGGGSHASRSFSGGSHFGGRSHSGGGGHFSSHGGGHSGGGGHSHGGGGHHR